MKVTVDLTDEEWEVVECSLRESDEQWPGCLTVSGEELELIASARRKVAAAVAAARSKRERLDVD